MELKQAQEISNKVTEMIAPYCDRIQVAGSIRRKKPFVHDIDIILIPNNQGQLLYQLQSMGTLAAKGEKLLRVNPSKWGIQIDIYVATPETWATLLLIRTGSARHNIKLCSLAKTKGMTLKADGTGLIKWALNQTEYENAADERVAGDTEESIFQELGLAYVPPEKRD